MNSERRSLILIWNYLEWGGAQIYFLAIIKEAKKNWDITVILPKNSGSDMIGFLQQLGVKYEFIDVWLDNSPALTVRQKLKRQWRRIHAEISSFFYLQRFDLKNSIVHLESAPWQSWILLAALALQGNVFVTVHNALAKNSEWRETIWKMRLKLLSKLNRFHIFTANQDAKDSLKRFVGDDFWQNIPVTYAGINPPEIDVVLKTPTNRREIFQKLNLPIDNLTILCVGQFVDRKGRWIFLEAAEKVLKIEKNVSFVWLMPKLPDRETSEKIAKFELGESFYPILSANVGKNRADILNFIKIADLFALPSLLEGLPISLLEAMALKQACISTNINSIPEAVKHQKTGWLINPGNANELAEAIITLKSNSKLRESLAEDARAFVSKNFDERESARLAIERYDNCFK